jgi:hypothetical protein
VITGVRISAPNAADRDSSSPCSRFTKGPADLVKRRTMVINQLKAKLHVWLDHTPGDLTRSRNLTALAALTSTATVTSRVRQALADMTGEIADLSQRVRDLDAAMRELVTPLASALLQVTGISHNSAAVLIAEIGDITRFTSSAKLAATPAAPRSPSTPPTKNASGHRRIGIRGLRCRSRQPLRGHARKCPHRQPGCTSPPVVLAGDDELTP